MNQIKFINTRQIDDAYKPQPAKHFIPDWYNKLQSYIENQKLPNLDGTTNATIKKCMPVFDALTAGYVILTHVDIYVRQVEDAPFYTWASQDAITFHPIAQAPTHPNKNGFDYPKFINPWGIKTPKNYSCLIIPPMHRENIINILPGIVDTDIYTNCINFPFVLSDSKFTGLIPAGTPIAQVIPIKRRIWSMKLTEKNTDLKQLNNIAIKLRSVFHNGYKNFFWQKKHYN